MLFHRFVRRKIAAAMGLAALGIAFWPAGMLHAKDDTRHIEATGMIDRTQSTAPVTRRPLDEALQNAVEQVVKSVISEAQWTARQADIQEKILKNPSVYVRNYQILEEKNVANTASVRILADVWIESVARDLKALGVVISAPSQTTAKLIRLNIKQPGHYRQVVALRKMLQESTPGVTQVITQSLSKDRVVLVVTLGEDGTLEQLQAALRNAQIDGKSMTISRGAENELEIKL